MLWRLAAFATAGEVSHNARKARFAKSFSRKAFFACHVRSGDLASTGPTLTPARKRSWCRTSRSSPATLARSAKRARSTRRAGPASWCGWWARRPFKPRFTNFRSCAAISAGWSSRPKAPEGVGTGHLAHGPWFAGQHEAFQGPLLPEVVSRQGETHRSGSLRRGTNAGQHLQDGRRKALGFTAGCLPVFGRESARWPFGTTIGPLGRAFSADCGACLPEPSFHS